MPLSQPASRTQCLANSPASLRVASQTITPRLLTIKEAAVYLSSAVWAVRQAIWSKELKACKVGNRFVIPREELDAFIDRRIAERAAVGAL